MATDREVLQDVQRRLTFIQAMIFRSGGDSALGSVAECKRVVDSQLSKPQK